MRQDYHNLNKEYPVSLKNLQGLINRVHARYPRLPKGHIALIIKHFFMVLRGNLLSGETVSISGLLNHFNLITFKRENYNVIKAKLSTPRCFKHS